MIAKRAYLAARHPSISATGFPEIWRTHSDLLQTFPKLSRWFERYRYCVVEKGARETATKVDGIGLFWISEPLGADEEARGHQGIVIASTAAAITRQSERFAASDPVGSQTMRADELRVFSHFVSRNALTAVEQLAVGGPADGACLFRFYKLGASRDIAPASMENIARTLLSASAVAQRTTRIASNVVYTGTTPYDAFVELWFASLNDARAAVADRLFMSALGRAEDGAQIICVASFTTSICHAFPVAGDD